MTIGRASIGRESIARPAIAGGSGPTDYTLSCAAGSFTLTGQTAGLVHGRSLTAGAGSFSLTGQAAALAHGRVVVTEAGQFTLTGQPATLDFTPAPRNLSLSCEAGSFTLTGQPAVLLLGALTAGASNSGGGGGSSGQDWRKRKSLKDLLDEIVKPLPIAKAEELVEAYLPPEPSPEAVEAVAKAVSARKSRESAAARRQLDGLLRRLRVMKQQLRDEEEAVVSLLLL